MRTVAALATLALAAACTHPGWDGDQALSRTFSNPADTLVYAAARALTAHGYTPRIVNGKLLVTLPREVPQYARPVSTHPETDPNSWVVEVRVTPESFRAGNTLAVAAYMVPRASSEPTDTTTKRTSVPVTSAQPQLFQEVQRIANWITEELQKSP